MAPCWSYMAQVALGGVFQLQDELTERIVSSMSLPLSPAGQ
jgi:TolB-like protein